MKWGLLAISFILSLTGCNPTFSSINQNQSGVISDGSELPFPNELTDLNPLPQTFEIPDENQDKPLPTQPPELTINPEVTDIPAAPAPIEKPKPQAQPGPKSSSLLESARLAIKNEARAIGTACNKYVMRVLELSGFAKGNFTANTFDDYAKKSISHYKVLDFKLSVGVSEIERLRRHLWSYPENTPFIMQWSRNSGYGHIAVLERSGDHLIIYQASLRQHIARKDQTTVQILLNGYNRRVLSVYSELAP